MFKQCTGVEVTTYSSCVLRYNYYVFLLFIGGTVTVYTNCAMCILGA